MILLDFDRTLFDTDAFYKFLINEEACAAYKDELAILFEKKREKVFSTEDERTKLLDRITASIVDGSLQFPPGSLTQFLYPDVVLFLKSMENNAIVITHGERVRQQAKVEGALSGIPRLTIWYTELAPKAEFLAHTTAWLGPKPLLVDDLPQELERVNVTRPDFTLIEMRRDREKGDGRWPVAHSLGELPSRW